MLTAAEVAKYLTLKNDGAGDVHLPSVIEATNSFVYSLPDVDMTIQVVEGVQVEVWAAHSRLAAKMFAARLYGRRNSANGIEAMTEMGTSYVARYDPDIARMLHLDSFAKPKAR